jgi:hypothetical protein
MKVMNFVVLCYVAVGIVLLVSGDLVWTAILISLGYLLLRMMATVQQVEDQFDV